jgi:two-component system sensor histidine kinase/response regulator
MSLRSTHKIILVVDDEDDVRELLRVLLEREGYRVECARDGSEGLALAKSLRPDLVITDHIMPGLSGKELIRAMGKTPALAATAVIMITGASMSEALSDALGAVDVKAFLPKPSTWKAIRETVHACLGDKKPAGPPRDELSTEIGKTWPGMGRRPKG